MRCSWRRALASCLLAAGCAAAPASVPGAPGGSTTAVPTLWAVAATGAPPTSLATVGPGLVTALVAQVPDCRPGGALHGCVVSAATARPFDEGGARLSAYVVREAYDPSGAAVLTRWVLLVVDGADDRVRQRLPAKGSYLDAPPGECFPSTSVPPLVVDRVAGTVLGLFRFCGDGAEGAWFWRMVGGQLVSGVVPTSTTAADPSPLIAGHSLTVTGRPGQPLLLRVSTGRLSPVDPRRLGSTTCAWAHARYRCATT